MKSYTPKKIFAFLLLIFPFFSDAQDKVTITFNAKGQIIYILPALLTTNSKVRFVVEGDRKAHEARVATIYSRFMQTLKTLDERNDKKEYVLLVKAGLQFSNDAMNRLVFVKNAFATQLFALLNDPENKRIIGSTRDVSQDSINLLKIIKDNPANPAVTLYVPNISTLINEGYYVNNTFSGGDQGKLKDDAIICNQTLELSPDQACCSVHFGSGYVNFKAYNASHYFMDSIELRMHNGVFLELSRQINFAKANKQYMTSFDYQGARKTIPQKLKDYQTTDDIKLLFKYLDQRQTSKIDDDVKKNVLKLPQATLTAAYKQISNSIPDDFYTPQNVNFLVDLAWLSSDNLTANPLKSSPTAGVKSPVELTTQELADSTQSLADLNERLTSVKGILGTAGVSCCGGVDYIRLEKKMQDLRVVITKKIADLKKSLDSQKKAAAKTDKTGLSTRETLYSDSLFYQGGLTINPANCGIAFSPNNVDYVYMRNHNALQSMNNMDLVMKKDINERQSLDVRVINANAKSKYVFKETFTDAPANLDYFSSELTSAPTAADAANPTLDDLAEIYQESFNILTPYQNGVIAYPLPETKDQTPDYQSVKNSLALPAKTNQYVAYTVQDTTNAKNPIYTFNYRYNKLYRFRLKAGIAYSSLVRRAYTINQVTNTSTYIDSYAGLAPTFGVQIFTSRLDLQNDKILPTGLLPYFYVGYMFHDTPVNNFLLGGGFEIFSGVAIAGGIHVGKTQGLSVQQGNLVERDHYTFGKFVSINIGLEAFSALFNTSKLPNPNKAP